MASLVLAYGENGAAHVRVDGRSMVIGAVALYCHSAACVAGTRREHWPVWLCAGLAWVVWLAAAFGLWAAARAAGAPAMKPRVDLAGLKNTKGRDYLVRFAFGGLITACAGLVTHAWGPSIGGLLLGFPAILPASLTLVKERDGRAQAVDDAKGARLGSLGLMAFALAIWGASGLGRPAVVLGLATTTWLGVSLAAWWLEHRHDKAP
jgi:hypothetical protein